MPNSHSHRRGKITLAVGRRTDGEVVIVYMSGSNGDVSEPEAVRDAAAAEVGQCHTLTGCCGWGLESSRG
jgi:hypothetical protein